MHRSSRVRGRHAVYAMVAAACLGGRAVAADFTQFEATPLKEPECITDASQSFVVQNGARLGEAWHALPDDRYYMVVRYLGDDAVAAAPAFDFSRFPPSYGWSAVRGHALTNFAVPEPKSAWQRANSANADVDTSSAFQLHCYDAASYLNTWTFPYTTIAGGGPHAIYGYTFNQRPPPAIFDSNPATDFVLQASVEVPWFAAWSDSASALPPIGQVSFFAYFHDRFTNKTFALLLGVFDNRYAENPTYASFVAHDGQTPFVSMPLNGDAAFATPSPASAAFTGTTWTGLKFFRAHITQQNFRDAVAAVNAYCRAHLLEQHCNLMPYIWDAFSPSVDNYELTEFGVLHELFRGPGHNLSMAVHVHDLGAWNFR
jgi:hypothetical protein